VGEIDRSLDLEVVTTDEGLFALRADWDALHEVPDGPRMNPFTSWTFVWEWWQAHIRTKRFAQPRVRLHIVVLRDIRQQVRAILPFVQARWGVGPLVFRALRFYGFGPNPADLRGPLVSPGWETAAFSAKPAARPRNVDTGRRVMESVSPRGTRSAARSTASRSCIRRATPQQPLTYRYSSLSCAARDPTFCSTPVTTATSHCS